LHLSLVSFIVEVLILVYRNLSGGFFYMSIAQNIRYYREHQSITLDDFSKKTGLTIADCIKIEAGQRPLTSAEITKVCEVLDISVDELISDRDVSAPGPQRDPEGSVVMPLGELQNLLSMMNKKG